MFIVITGLDGSGTSTVAEKLHELDVTSFLTRTPSKEYQEREKIDSIVRQTSQMAHYLYYLSSVVFISDYIKKNFDYKNRNVYCVRYFIDTTVSHQVAGLNVEYDYGKFNILEPDLTIFVGLPENIRQDRINKRGKSILDKVLDDKQKRESFLKKFQSLLGKNVIYFDNSTLDIDTNIKNLYDKIKEAHSHV